MGRRLKEAKYWYGILKATLVNNGSASSIRDELLEP